MTTRDAAQSWFTPSQRAAPRYVEPKWDVVRIRVLRPFRWRAELRRAGVAIPLEEARTLEVGELIDAIAPDAVGYVARGLAEFVK